MTARNYLQNATIKDTLGSFLQTSEDVNLILRLRQDIATVDDNVRPSLVRRGIAGEIQVQALDFLDVSLSTKGSHPVGLVQALGRCSHFRIEESRRDYVYAGELPPFSCQTLAKVGHGCLGGVVYLVVCQYFRTKSSQEETGYLQAGQPGR